MSPTILSLVLLLASAGAKECALGAACSSGNVLLQGRQDVEKMNVAEDAAENDEVPTALLEKTANPTVHDEAIKPLAAIKNTPDGANVYAEFKAKGVTDAMVTHATDTDVPDTGARDTGDGAGDIDYYSGDFDYYMNAPADDGHGRASALQQREGTEQLSQSLDGSLNASTAPSPALTQLPCKRFCQRNTQPISVKCSWARCKGCKFCEPSPGPAPPTGENQAIPSPSPTMSPEQKYLSVEKSLYVWNPGKKMKNWWDWTADRIALLVSFCTVHNFKRAIVFVGTIQWDWKQHFSQNKLPNQANFVNLFAALRLAGISVSVSFYVNDDPESLTNWEEAADVVSAVHQFNVDYPDSAIDGIDGDQEPNTITPDYIAMNNKMRARRDKLGATFEIAASLKPGWLRKTTTFDSTNAAAAAIDSLDHAMIMAYNSAQSVSEKFGKQALEHGASVDRKVAVAIETSPRAPETDTFWSMCSGSNRDAFFDMVYDMDQEYRASAHAKLYKDFVIHDYEGYFEAMYGLKATSFDGTSVSALHS